MTIRKSGSRPSDLEAPDHYTGTVHTERLMEPPAPARVRVLSVSFEPGSRTAWHAHPFGQTLIVTSGSGWAQRWGGPREDIQPGDVIWFPPGEKHWHGATLGASLTHIAVVEHLDGMFVQWMEKVTDDQYAAHDVGGAAPELRSTEEDLPPTTLLA